MRERTRRTMGVLPRARARLQPPRQWAQVEGAEPSSPSADGETLPRPFSFCQAFSFGPTWAKEKAEVGALKHTAAIAFGRNLR